MERIIYRNLEYLNGHLRYGHQELHLTREEDIIAWDNATDEEKLEWFEDDCHIVIDDFRINDFAVKGDIYE